MSTTTSTELTDVMHPDFFFIYTLIVNILRASLRNGCSCIFAVYRPYDAPRQVLGVVRTPSSRLQRRLTNESPKKLRKRDSCDK